MHLIDPDTHQEWVAVRAEVFKRVKHLLYEDGERPESAFSLADEVFKEDWDDPKMAE